jgi:hypothetical protein
MGCIILFDPKNERAVFFDTVTERAVNHDAFVGDDAQEQAEDFLEWEDYDPRSYPREGYSLDDMIGLWRFEAFNDMEDFVGTRWPRRVPADA